MCSALHLYSTFMTGRCMDLEVWHWKISDFAKLLGKHNNTVDGWFRTLEEDRQLHYINRINDEKVYDELDLEIARFILDRRNEKWSLDAIYDSLPDRFSLRPFPLEFERDEKPVKVVDIDKIRATILAEMKSTFEQISVTQMEKQMQDFQRMLPSPNQQRLDRFNTLMAERRVARKLEDEALSIWATKPDEERLIKVGWFRKEEDKDKRDSFIRAYIDEHFEEQMKKEFGLD